MAAKVSVGKLAKVPQALQESISRTKAEYRRLGKSGLRVSNPILGGLHVGDPRWFPWVLDESDVSFSMLSGNVPAFAYHIFCG